MFLVYNIRKGQSQMYEYAYDELAQADAYSYI